MSRIIFPFQDFSFALDFYFLYIVERFSSVSFPSVVSDTTYSLLLSSSYPVAVWFFHSRTHEILNVFMMVELDESQFHSISPRYDVDSMSWKITETFTFSMTLKRLWLQNWYENCMRIRGKKSTNCYRTAQTLTSIR